MKKYLVSARFYVAADYEVEASSKEEALEKGDHLFQSQDISLPENLEIMDVCKKESWSIDEISITNPDEGVSEGVSEGVTYQ